MSKQRSDDDQIAEAEERASRALADANEAAERGAKKTAERFFDRSQRWLDRATKLRRWK